MFEEEDLLTDEEVELCCTMADLEGFLLALFGLYNILGILGG